MHVPTVWYYVSEFQYTAESGRVSCLVSGFLNVFALPGSRPRVAPTAAKLEEARKQKLQELQEVFKPLQANPANQKVSFQLYHNVDLILALQHSEYINIDLPSG
jgi:hypothetical protein